MMCRRSLISAISVALLAGPPASAIAAETAQGRYAPGLYEVDVHATRVHFRVASLLGAYEGDFIEPVGHVTVASMPSGPDKADIDIGFPVSRLTTGDASTDRMLKGASFFDMDRYPTVRFVAKDAPVGAVFDPTRSACRHFLTNEQCRSSGNRSKDGDMLRIDGTLTMHGQSRAVTVTAHLAGTGPLAPSGQPGLRFTGEAFVKRSDFGMGFGRPFVADRVELSVDATFRHVDAQPPVHAPDPASMVAPPPD